MYVCRKSAGPADGPPGPCRPLLSTKNSNFAHITLVLKSLHSLKIEQRIQYQVASITFRVLQSEQLSYLHSLLNVLSMFYYSLL